MENNTPLTEALFYILLVVGQPNHGYGIIQEVSELTNGRVVLGPGTLYGAINSMLSKRWIELYSEDKASRKKKEYLITESGKKVLNPRSRTAERTGEQCEIMEGKNMKKVRFYFDKDREQDWLMDMSNQGWAFERFFFCVYTFAPSQPGEYLYQIDLLDNWSGNQKDFADFMADSGVEVVSQWYRWVFLRKKAADGPFEMYTDVDSKIAQYNRVKNFFLAGLLLELLCFGLETAAALSTGRASIWVFVLLIGLVCLAFLRMVLKCKSKVAQLKRNSV